jgi:hypothetical protein
MTKKRIVILESFLIVGSFDCDRIHIHNTKDPNIEKTLYLNLSDACKCAMVHLNN